MYWQLDAQQQQMAQQLIGSFGGTTGSNLHGESEKWRPGKGVLVLGRAERKNTAYGMGLFVDGKIEWFRGGVDLQGGRVPDDAMRAGDAVSYKVMDSNPARGPLFKGFALATTRSHMLAQGQDPQQCQPDHITDADPAAIVACQGQHGLRVAFVVTAKLSKNGHPYPRVTLEGGTMPEAPPMSAPPPAGAAGAAGAAPPFGQPPAVGAAPPPFGQPPPAGAAGAAGAPPFGQPPPAGAAPINPFGTGAVNPYAAAAMQGQPVDAAAAGAVARPAGAAPPFGQQNGQAPGMTRDQKIAAIKLKLPHLAAVDFTQVSDAQLDAQL